MPKTVSYIFARFPMLLQGAFVLLLVSTTGVLGQVSTRIDTTSIRIGEEIQYTITVEADSTDLVLFPEGQTFLPLEVIESVGHIPHDETSEHFNPLAGQFLA